LNSITQLATVPVPADRVAFRDASALENHLRACPGIAFTEIGRSRAGQPLFGYTLGNGPNRITVTAGCHADEPVGPMTAQALPELLAAHAPELLESCHFRVVPQMNPDGADRNRAWFADPPDFETYLAHAVREQPGDDIEFGFANVPEARPECRAALRYLWSDGPVAAHFSLHGMAWAEGAWFLINEAWGDRVGPLMDDLGALCQAHGLPQMEIDRKGEKGFRRLGKGISTTPTSTAMKAHFLALEDPDMAARFLPSSMEAAAGAGGDPLCMVSELPLFLLDVPASLADPVLYRFQKARDAALATDSPEAIRDLAREFRLRPLPMAQQVAVQFAMIVLALRHRLAQPERPSR
jgi:hypothetical protein